MKIRIHLLCCACVCLLAGALAVAAQWDKKTPTEWSEREAQKLLNDSPWAQTQTFSDLSQARALSSRDWSAKSPF
jgi:hypothetical protein